MFHCPFCLSAIKEKEKLEEHVECCRENEPAKATFPKNKKIKFKDQKYMLKAPVTMYGDFESLLVKVNKTFGGKSEIKSEHKACGFSLVITSPYFPRRERRYRGEDAAKKFIEVLYEERNKCLKFIQKESHKKMNLTPEEKEAHKKATTCWICGEKGFTKTGKVASPQNKAEQKHLRILRPHLATCEMDMEKIPSLEEVMKNRKKQLHDFHPDKNSKLEEKERKEKEEKCKKLVAAFRSIIDYFKKHNLSEVVVERDELDEILDDEEMPIYEGKILKDYAKVRDHDHFTGEYRGAAHSKCNFKLQVERKNAKIPVFFHNLQNYDAHHIMNGLSYYGRNLDDGVLEIQGEINQKIEVLGKSLEQFFRIKLGNHLIIKDSFNFLSYSLDKLVKDRKSTQNLPELFPATYAFFKEKYDHLSEDAFELLTRKGVYPYSYMDSHAKFTEDKLPPIEAYRNDLTGEELSEEDYKFAKTIWNTFQLQNLGQLHDLYVSTDTHLLADVFNGFRDSTHSQLQLDPAHYVTLPSLSWSAALKVTNVNLELIDDIDMYLFVEKIKLGGYAAVVEHFAKANNKYLKNYEAEKPTSYIFSTDCTNNYGAAMKMSLPVGGFKWVENVSMFTEEYIKNLEADQSIGYFIEADLEYPDHLHDAHDSFPLGPEKIKITSNMLSDYQNNLAEKLGNKPGGTKLCLTLNDKEKYTCHYRQLKQMLYMGMKLKKVHRVLQFNQSAWLQTYIDMNTENRREAQDSGNKCKASNSKLMNNALFGKENNMKIIYSYIYFNRKNL